MEDTGGAHENDLSARGYGGLGEPQPVEAQAHPSCGKGASVPRPHTPLLYVVCTQAGVPIHPQQPAATGLARHTDGLGKVSGQPRLTSLVILPGASRLLLPHSRTNIKQHFLRFL
jgi:hypothetical protein